MPPVHEANPILTMLRLIGKPPYLVIIGLLETLKILFKLLNFKKLSLKIYSLFFLFFFITFTSSSIYIYYQIIKPLPSADLIFQTKIPTTSHIYDRTGVLLYQLYETQNRTPIKINDLPIHVIQAHLAIEDNNFFHHQGISPKDITRAIIHNIKYLKCRIAENSACPTTIQGASTITQQLVKNTLLSPERTIKRKLQEMYLALQIERKFHKSQILEQYLNTISYGGTAYGIESASYQYFDKSSTQLSIAESALLAGLPVAPSTYSPFGNQPSLAINRQKVVLQRMLELNYISPQDFQEAINQELTFSTPKTNIKAPHFVMYTRSELEKKFSSNILYQGGLQITTTLDYSLQEFAQLALNEEINRLKNLNVTNGAILITKPKTGEIIAMVGSTNYFDTKNQGNVNATTALRQPGSSIKPLTYALALTNNFTSSKTNPITASTIILDTPVTYKSPGSPDYKPRNYDGNFHGPVTFRTALASSYNVPAVKLLNQVGVSSLISFAQSLGISTWTQPKRYGLALTLGGAEIKMTDLAIAYATFANLGYKQTLTPILQIQGNTPTNHNLSSPFQPTPILDPSIAYIINDILSDPVARAPTFGRISKLTIPNHQVAVKTGTSNDLRDNWTIGYTPDYLVAVWVGNFDNSPMSRIASGITGATPIWNKIMTHLLNEHSSPNSLATWQKPNNLIQANTCYNNIDNCSNCHIYKELYVKGTEPKCSNTAQNPYTLLSQVSISNLLTPSPTPTSSFERKRPRVARQH